MNSLIPATRVALAALLHDLGKLAERAGLPHHDRLDAHKNLYCPWHPTGKHSGWHSHVHAAYTGLAWDALEATGHFPDLRRDSPPFLPAGDGDTPDSAVNAASAHHCPQTFLQWIVATADRVASGFEREEFDQKYNQAKERDNHYRARLLTLFEQIGQPSVDEGRLTWRYPLRVLSPDSVFPQRRGECTPSDDASARAEYRALWQALLDGLRRIPKAHLADLPLWLDHFDSLWLTVTHAIPSATAFGVKPEVSLYDHSKATAALAVALWRWHADRGDFADASLREGWGEEKILLVQGDF
ncbi:MAG TPA: type III-A CRISPR-associated protein Cas10/Csm1, partial [Accumulibacter sp.]|nr:type III-A CRISPR-associated protein Cas10/Csm1 [Accumulibacter sp.]